MREHDVVIVGAGPIGIELGVELKRRGIEFAMVEAGAIGSTMQWWAPGTRFYSSPERIAIAGVPLVTAGQEKATREEYLAYLRTVVGTFELDIETYTRVVGARVVDGGFEIETRRSSHGVGGPAELRPDPLADHTSIDKRRARRLVLAIGDMHRPRMLEVEGEGLPNVSHFLDDPHAYFGGRVLIVGGKNSAVEAAIRCRRIGCDVSVSYRGCRFDRERIKYWLLPEIEWLIRKDLVHFHPETELARCTSDGAVLRRIDPTRTEFLVSADHVLLLTGYVQDSSLFGQLGVELIGPNRKPRIHCDTMETNVSGVYVIGTGSAGTQSRARVFIETSHVHVRRVADALQGVRAEHPSPKFELEES